MQRLGHVEPAVHGQYRPGDVTGGVVQEESHRPGDLLRLAQPTHRDGPDHRRQRVRGHLATMSVAMNPGVTQFTVMPLRAVSLASDLVRPNRPDFDAA